MNCLVCQQDSIYSWNLTDSLSQLSEDEMFLTSHEVCNREITCHYKLRLLEDTFRPVDYTATGNAVQRNLRNWWLAFFGLKASNMKDIQKDLILN